MSDWKQVVALIASNVEDHYDALKLRLRHKLGIGPVQVLPYIGHGTRAALYLHGRVLADYSVTEPMDNDTIWQNMLNMYRRFNSHEVPQTLVRARFRDWEVETTTDEEGFFEANFKLDEPLATDAIWHEVQIALPEYADHEGARATGQVMIPPTSARFGVISDLDDTVLKTDVANLLKVARNTFLNNAHTRLPFSGVAAFYQALQQGTRQNFNPIYYVSNAPWNLYDLLVDFFEVREIPLGALFLVSLGLTDEHLIRPSGMDHKLGAIEHLLNTHPDLPFILIGDSGELDPEIYLEAVRNHPGRIPTIYIRDVSGEGRNDVVGAIADEVHRLGAEMLLVPDTIAAAVHAVQRGYISADALPAIREERDEDEKAPEGVEKILDADTIG
ncbi:MAG: DUF2183 domain-containing protein [Chloroflexi bacterium]|nr:DUF2183 domain-containing protein [Chloroflexota bacterium]